ncbi:ArsR/SmtB family transcription factor [Amycolatopsis suaedae]|uniref:Transcriptional regulator n=1 Tax=Amycolatopsis suaedae TaxID=2510978 RepID=A0A4Q7J8Y3_9PSEU|nr:metalloregulator ArsR/SmtB family transcription factor [Amycolatopsis suaedae]RZQ62843.1 transcriptional regulator [Amycolatopsis suaedae]
MDAVTEVQLAPEQRGHSAQPARDEIHIEAVLHALADPVRLAIVRQLAGPGCEIACRGLEVSVSKSTLTHHLRILREAGVITDRHQGTAKYNSLRREDLDALFPGLLNGILAAPR